MNTSYQFTLIPLFLIIVTYSSLQAQEVDSLVHYRVEQARDWTDFFYRNDGWFGADGIFEVRLNGNESVNPSSKDSILMYFSDTMTGKIIGDSLVRDFKMINNSFAWIKDIPPSDSSVQLFYNKNRLGRPINYFNPESINSEDGEYYWLGDGFINHADNNSLNIFAYRVFDKSEKSWDFEIHGVTLITIPDIHNLSETVQTDLPLFIDTPTLGKGTFGAGIYVNTKKAGAPFPDGFVYVYGVIDPNKQLVLGRVLPSEIRNISKWEFYSDGRWSPNIGDITPIADRVSNELSLTPISDGRYLLVFQLDGVGEYTAIRVAASPSGPFGPIQKIFKAPEINELPGLIPYNAKAHPVLSYGNKLLISYNTISLDYFNDILKFPHLYRPRFIWLHID